MVSFPSISWKVFSYLEAETDSCLHQTLTDLSIFTGEILKSVTEIKTVLKYTLYSQMADTREKTGA